MGRKYQVSQDYPVSAQVLWDDILDPQALSNSMEGQIHYEGLPTEPVYEGQRIVVKLKRWGWFPMGKWTMDIVKLDDQNFILESAEFGNIIRSHKHRLEVTAIDEHQSRYTDFLDIDAGIFTQLVFPSIQKMYDQRHLSRLQRLIDL